MLRKLSLSYFTGVFLLGVNSLAVTSPPACPEIANPRGQFFEIGLVYQSLIPSGLPDFTKTQVAFGGVLGFPFLKGTLQLQATGGGDTNTGFSLYLAESSYRFEIPTPFANLFLWAGGHFLYYQLGHQPVHRGVGAHFGLGTAFLMGKGFEVSLSLKTYIQQRTMVSLGGGFSFLL
jgi:hypothetical protein